MIDNLYGDDTADYEPIYQALFDLTAGVTWGPEDNPGKFLTRSRRLVLFNAVPPEAQPAIYQAEHDEDEVKGKAGSIVTLSATWFVYFNTGRDKGHEPTRDANAIMSGIRRALRPPVTDPGFHDRKLTLGGLAQHVRIEGKVFKDPGDLDDQGLLIVPIKLTVP